MSNAPVRARQPLIVHYLRLKGQMVRPTTKRTRAPPCGCRPLIFFLKVKGLSFSITKEGGVE
ncbi:hypothetical protein DPMN_017110 [Dreissena polymorpha]|uniref:Uncharacterized protein n=1 Tax=Dreissena polymorpha TaxID=45954 RepID=A0A9D4NE90_DREPO|nr:hypothetical protein DPMN_017110 [Dreissena polymorpha]